MNAQELSLFIETVDVDKLKDDYSKLPLLDFKSQYNLSYGNISVLKFKFDLNVSEEDRISKIKNSWAKKETSSQNRHSHLEELVSRDDLISIYISANNSFEDTCKYFDITSNDLLYLLNKYDCKKPKNISCKLTKQTKQELYGDCNYNNREKSKQTCIEKYGVDNTFKSPKLMGNAFSIKESRYGIGNGNNWVKGQDTRISNSGDLKTSYEIGHKHFVDYCLQLYGVDNPAKLPEVKAKIASSLKNTFLDRYGATCYWNTEEAILSYNSKDSKPNLEFKNLLLNSGLYVDDKESREIVISNRRYDFKVDNKLIEINPTATHNSTWSPFDRPLDKKYHFNKSQLAKDNGYRCIHIWDWDDKDKIIRLFIPRETIYARKCCIKEVDSNITREYLNTYHLQGYAKDSIRIGLFYDDKLVSIMTFGKPRYNKKYEYELIRYCSSYNIIGGAEKLFTFFIRNYNPQSIISYCDWSKFSGDVYEKLNFTFHNYSIGKHWYNMITDVHITDNLLRQRGFDQLFGTNYGKGTSNEELMIEHGFVEIYDAGQAKYVWRVDLNEI